MAKSLVIVESPAKAKTISKYLGKEYIVESSVGHIRDLPKKALPNSKRSSIPKDVSPEEKARLKAVNDRNRLIRRMGIDPDNGWTADWQIIPEKEKVIKSLRKAAKGVDHIYLATDLDREGEAIAWHLKEALGPEKYDYSRVRFNQITKTAIIDSFADPKEIDLDLVKAYRARRFLDKVIGFELSPLRNLFDAPLMPDELEGFDMAILDPPRSGAAAQCQMLSQSGIATIAMVSCNPASFARDAAILIESGFRLEWVQVIDQFSFSNHLEMIGAFRR